MVTLTVLMGPPGAGKTTWMQANPSGVICSTERIRTDRSLTTQATVAFLAALQAKARRCLRDGQDVLIDGCNTKKHERTRWLRIAGEGSATPRLIVLHTPLADCLGAQREREHPVPDHKVRRYFEEFTASLGSIQSEGWHSIQIVTRDGILASTSARW